MTESETVQLLVDLLAKGEPFCHVRFGDGDVFFATGTGPKLTADGEEWSRDLQLALLEAWSRCCMTENRLLVGDVNSYVADDGCGYQWEILRAYGGFCRGEPLELVHIEALRCGWGHALPLYLAIANDTRPKFYIAPAGLAPAAEMLGAEHIEVPLREAWKTADYMIKWFPDDSIVLLSAGRGGKIIQGHLCHEHLPVTQIDIGSGLDLLFTDLRRSTDFGSPDYTRASYRQAGLKL